MTTTPEKHLSVLTKVPTEHRTVYLDAVIAIRKAAEDRGRPLDDEMHLADFHRLIYHWSIVPLMAQVEDLSSRLATYDQLTNVVVDDWVKECERLKAELAEANRQRQITDDVLAHTKALLERRTETLRVPPSRPKPTVTHPGGAGGRPTSTSPTPSKQAASPCGPTWSAANPASKSGTTPTKRTRTSAAKPSA